MQQQALQIPNNEVVATLDRHEETIRRGLTTFVEVGNALAAIRDGRLYRLEFETFEAYVAERWGWTRDRAYKLIAASEAAACVENFIHKPVTESHAAALAKAPATERPAVWQEVVEESEATGKPVTAKRVQEVVNRRTGEVIDAGDLEPVKPEPQPKPKPPRVQSVVVTLTQDPTRDAATLADRFGKAYLSALIQELEVYK